MLGNPKNDYIHYCRPVCMSPCNKKLEILMIKRRFLGMNGASKGVSCVACHSFCTGFCSCSVACSIILNAAVAFEQKLKLYVGLVMLHTAGLSLSQIVMIFLIISVACRCFENGLSQHFQTVSPVTQNPWRAP